MELEVQKFLRSGGTLQSLQEKFAIKAKQHHEYYNLWTLKYSMIDSPMDEPIVRECRGQL
jgi:hypothetical protein